MGIAGPVTGEGSYPWVTEEEPHHPFQSKVHDIARVRGYGRGCTLYVDPFLGLTVALCTSEVIT